MTTETYAEVMAEWEKQRLADLKNPTGYLSLVGLHWLQLGENSFGSASTNRCQFPAGLPHEIGRFIVAEDGISIEINSDVTVFQNGEQVGQMAVLSDRDKGGPTIFEIGTVNWFVIKRGDALGIRVRDSNSELIQTFVGVDRYPAEEKWRIQGAFKPYDQPRIVPVPTILGTDEDYISPGTIDIEVDGEKRSLVALKAADPKRFFLVVADGLSGSETYGGGRFLTTEQVDDAGNIVLDFNKATNPPCAFTPWATCPRPPAENKFSVNIPAGEKVYSH